MVVFDYVYYSIACLHLNYFKKVSSYKFSGVVYLSLIQFINTLTILEIFNPIEAMFKEPIFFFIICIVVVFLMNLIRYNKFVNYGDLSRKWDSESNMIRQFKMIGVIFYFVLSFILLVYVSS